MCDTTHTDQLTEIRWNKRERERENTQFDFVK